MRRFFSALRKSWGRPVSLLIVAHGPLPMLRLQFSAHFLIFLVAIWTGATIWAGYIIGKHVDYQVTKADNKVLHTKIAYVAQEISREKKYLEMTRKTESEMRQILGMNTAKVMPKDGGETGMGGANASEVLDFKKVLEKKANEIKESMFRRSIQQIGEESRNRLASFQEIAWHMANQRTVESATPDIVPTWGRITSPFGYRMGVFAGEEGAYHRGVDIGADSDTPVRVTADGVVRHAGWAEGYGQAVLVDHGFGYSTLYGHLAEIKVKEGEHVRRAQIIAGVGTTGRSTGNHLHYEVWRDGSPVNPVKFFNVADLSGPAADKARRGQTVSNKRGKRDGTAG
ncbi:MAG: M23 family metallopeptidase [Elusimicrobia bacterium]|nr:M23 family metallopeptidase [Elusimicrobiota bacterium]